MKHLSDAPRPPSVERPDIPPDLDMVVLRALAKDPDDRFQTAEEMDAELERVARGPGSPTRPRMRRRPSSRARRSSSAPTAIVPPRRPPADDPAGLPVRGAAASAADRSGPGCSRCSSSSPPAWPAGTPTGGSRTR